MEQKKKIEFLSCLPARICVLNTQLQVDDGNIPDLPRDKVWGGAHWIPFCLAGYGDARATVVGCRTVI
jgi:hypothetical protein